ncbi:MAG: metallophosphoesterase family protein [Chloroflexi bacterium]|nr:metallophosphoesterase family protein [Chloroflexota bacterium]
MRIALISDIHANFIALQTVLAHIERDHVNQIVCLGDVAANGPQPVPVIRRVRELGCPVVCGNTDEWFLVPQTYDPNSEKERRLMAMLEWEMQQFSSADLEFMRAFQPRVNIQLEGNQTLLCFHGSPQSNTDLILATTPENELQSRLGDYRATVLAGGHTHQQMLRRFRDALVINPGSVGMPMERDALGQLRRPPWSEYAILDSRDQNIAIEFHRVPLDVNAVVRAARESGMPHGELWAGEWLV